MKTNRATPIKTCNYAKKVGFESKYAKNSTFNSAKSLIIGPTVLDATSHAVKLSLSSLCVSACCVLERRMYDLILRLKYKH